MSCSKCLMRLIFQLPSGKTIGSSDELVASEAQGFGPTGVGQSAGGPSLFS